LITFLIAGSSLVKANNNDFYSIINEKHYNKEEIGKMESYHHEKVKLDKSEIIENQEIEIERDKIKFR
jgi:hypothetical protein